MDGIKIFGGSSSTALAEKIGGYLDFQVGQANVEQFPDGEKLVKLEGQDGDDAARTQAYIDMLTGATSSHTNCARCFKKLFEEDRAAADSFNAAAEDLVLGIVNTPV